MTSKTFNLFRSGSVSVHHVAFTLHSYDLTSNAHVCVSVNVNTTVVVGIFTESIL